MKRIALTLIAILLVAFPCFSQNVIIPDTAFLHALIDEITVIEAFVNPSASMDVQNNITLSLPAKSGRYYANILQTQKN